MSIVSGSASITRSKSDVDRNTLMPMTYAAQRDKNATTAARRTLTGLERTRFVPLDITFVVTLHPPGLCLRNLQLTPAAGHGELLVGGRLRASCKRARRSTG